MFDLAAALGRKPGVGDNPGITCAQACFTGLVNWRNLQYRYALACTSLLTWVNTPLRNNYQERRQLQSKGRI
jgi:hypothetical protein